MHTLNEKQRRLAEENLDIVNILLHTKIRPRKDLVGMEYDDLFSVGCIALCNAAETFTGTVGFRTYASTVVYHALVDECRRAQANSRNTVSYDTKIPGHEEDSFGELLGTSDSVDDELLGKELMTIIVEAKRTYKGVILKGVEAIELQIRGYSGAEIAGMYGVPENHVSSWISSARKALKRRHPEYA